jgi:predicted dinucleotide-utilizing enzyme
MCVHEVSSRVQIGKHPIIFAVNSELKQENDLSSLLGSYSVEYIVRKVQENQKVWNEGV